MKQIKWAVLVAAIALVGYAAWIALNDPEQIVQAFQRVGWLGFTGLCIVSFGNYFLRYIRWRLLMRAQSQVFPFIDGFICYLSGFALITTPGKVGESIRALFFKERHGVPITSSLSSLLAERLNDLLTALLLGSAAFIFFNNLWWIFCLIVAISIIVIVAIFYSSVIERLAGFFISAMPSPLAKFISPIVESLPNFFTRMRELLTPKVFLLALLLSSLAWFIEGLGFAWLAHQLDVDASVLLLSSVFVLSLVAGVSTPGGVGSAEAAMAFFLIALGATPAAALVIALVCRFATFWFAIVLGMSALAYLMRGKTISHALLEASNG